MFLDLVQDKVWRGISRTSVLVCEDRLGWFLVRHLPCLQPCLFPALSSNGLFSPCTGREDRISGPFSSYKDSSPTVWKPHCSWQRGHCTIPFPGHHGLLIKNPAHDIESCPSCKGRLEKLVTLSALIKWGVSRAWAAPMGWWCCIGINKLWKRSILSPSSSSSQLLQVPVAIVIWI